MRHSTLCYISCGVVILLAVLACVLPGQTLQPTPDLGPNAVASAIAGTAQAASTQTEQARPVTSTATSVPTQGPTSTPRISEVSGTALQVREDQSTLFVDYRAGIQLVIPPGWLALRLNEDEYFKAFTLDVVTQNRQIMERLDVTRDLDPVYFRLDAIDIRPEHDSDVIIPNINVIFQPGDVRSLDKWEKAERERSRPLAKYKFIGSSFPQLASGTQVLVIEEKYEAAEKAGMIYYRGVFFSLKTGTLVLDFYANLDDKDGMMPEFDQVVNSVTLLNP